MSCESRAVKTRRARSSAAMASDGAKLIHYAQVGDDAKVKRLLKARVDVNHGDQGEEGSSGITALQEACMNGHVGAVRPAPIGS